MRVDNTSPTMSTPTFDNGKEQRSNHRDLGHKHAHRSTLKYETTPAGDVVVVEPSFDADDTDNIATKGEGNSEWQQRSPTGDKGAQGDDQRSTPSGDELAKKRGHRRDLSAHFYEATTLSGEADKPQGGGAQDASNYGRREAPPTISPAAGQKHRRVFSGDVSNPAMAHRRINSIGTSAAVNRRQPGQHQRVDSAGLDVLTAAADVSREELASAAGHRQRAGRNPWEPPSGGSSRRSPIEMSSYDYSTMNVPPPRSTNRHSFPIPGPHAPTGYMSSPIGPHMGPPPTYPQQAYPAPSYYPPPPHAYPRGFPPPSMGYPVQYSRGHDLYAKHPSNGPPQQPSLDHPALDTPARHTSPPTAPSGDKRIGSDEKVYSGGNSAMTPPPPMPPPHYKGPGHHQGSQTFVTAIGVGEGNRTMRPSSQNRNSSIGTDQNERPTSAAGHHRKLSSFSSLGPLSSIFHAPGDVSEVPLKGHHRSTSSSVSFLQGFDVSLETGDAAFLKNLQASNAGENQIESKEVVKRTSPNNTGSDSEPNNKLAPGGTSKRVRRKCTVEGCPNRVVQGGLCISHGAKRKTCKHPGCNKNVKKAGLCSTHGPARKRCEAEGCSKVAVQGGRCIAHGAKKKLCSVDSCTKQAILGGMCKKHHDQTRGNGQAIKGLTTGDPLQCKVIGSDDNSKKAASSDVAGKHRKATHTRGLSIFQDLSADAVGTLLSEEAPIDVNRDVRRSSPSIGGQNPGQQGPPYSREYGMY